MALYFPKMEIIEQNDNIIETTKNDEGTTSVTMERRPEAKKSIKTAQDWLEALKGKLQSVKEQQTSLAASIKTAEQGPDSDRLVKRFKKVEKEFSISENKLIKQIAKEKEILRKTEKRKAERKQKAVAKRAANNATKQPKKISKKEKIRDYIEQGVAAHPFLEQIIRLDAFTDEALEKPLEELSKVAPRIAIYVSRLLKNTGRFGG